MATVNSNNNMLTQAQVHPDYAYMRPELKKVRDCVEGAYRIKFEGYNYLPHPSAVDDQSEFQKARYREFLEGAEFDNYPDRTRRAMIGKMRIHSATVEVPERISYLLNDADGDGLPLHDAIEYAANNILQMKYHALVVDYRGLGDADLQAVSIADARDANIRANIKQYARENIVNWHFDRVNGVMQLAWVMLLERGAEFNESSYTHEDIESYLILALDENGNYYQQKIVYGNGKTVEGERNYVLVSGQPMKWLPIIFAADEQLPPNMLPNQLGFISSICDLTLHKYRVSAYYKETQRNLTPTVFTNGWQVGDLEMFKTLNGRDYIATGGVAVNNMPDGVTVDIKSPAAEMTDFQWYFGKIDERILSAGGASKRDQVMTATEAEIYAAEQNAMLTSIADNLEKSFKKAITYCMMFEGLIAPEQVELETDEILINLPRDFATPKLSVEEVKALFEAYMQGIKTKEQVVTMLADGGWDYQSAQDTLNQLELSIG